MLKKYKSLALAMTTGATMMALYGCAETKQTTQAAPSDPALVVVADAAKAMTEQLKILSAIEQQSRGGYPVLEVAPSTGPLADRITLKWSGEPEKILTNIAIKSGYEMRIVGRRPVSPPIVTLDARNRKIFDVLQDIGLQLGERHGVQVNDDNQTITLVYREAR